MPSTSIDNCKPFPNKHKLKQRRSNWEAIVLLQCPLQEHLHRNSQIIMVIWGQTSYAWLATRDTRTTARFQEILFLRDQTGDSTNNQTSWSDPDRSGANQFHRMGFRGSYRGRCSWARRIGSSRRSCGAGRSQSPPTAPRPAAHRRCCLRRRPSRGRVTRRRAAASRTPLGLEGSVMGDVVGPSGESHHWAPWIWMGLDVK